MKIRSYLLSIFLLVSILVLGLESCKLSKPPIKEEEDYDKNSPLYGKTITGVAGDTQTLYATTEGKLWKRDNQTGQWSSFSQHDLLGVSKERSEKIITIFPSPAPNKNQTARIVIACPEQMLSPGLCIYELNFHNNTRRALYLTVMAHVEKQLIHNPQENSRVYLKTAIGFRGENYSELNVYDLFKIVDQSEEDPKKGQIIDINDEKGKAPNGTSNILGYLGGNRNNFLIDINIDKNQKDRVYQLRGEDFRRPQPVKCPAGRRIILLSAMEVRGAVRPVVLLDNNDIHLIDPKTGVINEQVLVKGLGNSVSINGIALLDDTYVVMTNRGYYEIHGDQMRPPSLATTDLDSYKRNNLDKTYISGIYQPGDGKVYLTTHGRGLWVRDTETKKWKGV